MANKKIKYAEPASYFPESVRREFGLGEFAKEAPAKKTEKKAPVKKADTKKTK